MILNHGIWGRDVITGFNSVQDLLTSYDKVDIYGGSVGTIIDKLWGRNIPLSFNDIYHMTSSNYFPSWTPETYMYAEFNGSIEAGNIIGLTERITFWNLYRQEVLPQEDGTYIPVGKFTFLDKIPADVRTYTDYTTTRQKYYRYYLFAQTETQFSQPALLPEIKSEYYGYYLIDMITSQTFKIDIGITGGDQTINMKYSQYDTNTKYNAIQKAVTNYKSGNLGGLLIENNDIDKVDNSIDLLEEFREFVYKDGIKFLKTRKGEMFNVFLSDYNETLIQQGIKEQPMLSNFAWREINDIVQPIDIEEDINAYRLYFSGNYEDSPREQVKYVKYENPIGILPNITRAGYTFLGWFVAKTGGTKLSSTSILSGTDNKVVYAQWRANKYTIVFNKNSADATGTMANQIVAYDTEVMLSQNTFKRANYEFIGWNTGKNGNETEYSDIQFISNLTDIDGAVINLYAQWQKIRLVVARYNIGRLTLTDAVATLYDDGVMEFTGARDTIVMTDRGQQPWDSELALIKSVTFSNTIRPTDLSYYFISCTKLTSISNIPNSVQLLNYTFHTCTSLVTPPTLPIGITSLDGTFYNCSVMTTAPVIPSTVVTMGSTFYQVPLVNPPIIPNGVTNMNTCFFGCIKLISAPVLPGNLNTMINTFNGCIAIVTAPIIPSGVVSMSGSFSGCTALKTFATLPPRVLNINNTFNNCKSLNGKMLIETVPTSYASFFVNCSTNVDANLIVDYTNANKNIIDAIIATKSTGSHITKGGNVDALKTYNIGNPTSTSVQATLYKDGLLEITGTGNTIAMASKDGQPWNAERMLIKSITFASTVKSTNLNNYFNSLVNLVNVSVLPTSVTTMQNTFDGCTSLVTAPAIPSGVTNINFIFYNCTALVNASTIPNTVTNMSYAFASCSSLITPPAISNKTIIMNYAFNSCTKLVTAPVIPNTVLDMSYTFQNCKALQVAPVLPNAITTLPATFYGCNSMGVAPAIPASVVHMNTTFYQCTTLRVTPLMPNTVTDMAYCYGGCTSLTTVTNIPDGVLFIGQAFNGCVKLTGKMLLKAKPTTWASFFNACSTDASANLVVDYSTNNEDIIDDIIATKSAGSHITKGEIERSVLKTWNIGSPVENDVVASLYSDGLFDVTGVGDTVSNKTWYDTADLERIKTVQFSSTVKPSSLTGWFMFCKNITKVINLPSSLTSMVRTFMECDSLIEVPDIPNSVTNMDMTFYKCISLVKTPVLPNKLKIASNTFSYCKSLVSPPVLPDGVVDISEIFSSCDKLIKSPIIPNSVEDMIWAFAYCKALVEPPNIPDKVTDIYRLCYVCSSLKTPPILNANIKSLNSAFAGCLKLTGRLLIDCPIEEYDTCFFECSVDDNASLIIDYSNSCESVIDAIIATKSLNSNITKGNKKTSPIKTYNIGNPTPTSVVATLYDNGLLEFTGAGNTAVLGYEEPWKDELKLITKFKFSDTVRPVNLSNYFQDCVNLESNTEVELNVIPSSVTNLENTFSGCKKLTTTPAIPNGVVNMTNTFGYCESLIGAKNLPASVVTANGTFQGCSKLIDAPRLNGEVTTMNGTFMNCIALEEVSMIPESVTSMRNTFWGCMVLKKVPKIPDGVIDMYCCFYNCRWLTETPTIPPNVTIMTSTFQDCVKIINPPNIPSKVINLKDSLYGCEDMTGRILIEASPDTFSGLFNRCATSPIKPPLVVDYVSSNADIIDNIIATKSNWSYIIKGVNIDIKIVATYNIGLNNPTDVIATLYDDGLLKIDGTGDTITWINISGMPWTNERALIKSVVFTSTVKSLDLSYYFYNCTSLVTAPNIPNSVTDMTYTFRGCTSLITAPTIPNSVTIMDSTFRDCTSLVTAPNIPNSVTIMDYTFYNCSSLVTAPTIPNSVINMPQTFRGCTSLITAPTIPNSVTIMDYTFYNCSSLVTVPTISNSVTDMAYTFRGCTSLITAPNIPNSVTIMDSTFRDCTSLVTAPTIPNSVINMLQTFKGCTKLKGNILIEAKSTTTYADCFQNCSTGISPDNLIVDYTSTNASIIDAIIATKSDNSYITKGVQKP